MNNKIITLLIISIFLIAGCTNWKATDKCREEYISKFNEGNDYYFQNKCEEKICNGFNLNKSSTGNWAKTITYCSGKNEGYIIVNFPNSFQDSHYDEECNYYFHARYDLESCLYDSGYLKDN